jgi:hypothetical protein
MDSGGREVDFREADRRYAELRRQLDAGTISIEEFGAQREKLMVQDEGGRWWAKIGESGEWYYHDGSTWVQGTPPGSQEVIEPADDRAQAPAPSRPDGAEKGEPGRGRMPRWVSVAGIVGITLAGIALAAIVLINSGLVPSLQGGSKNEPPSREGIVFDAVFVHRATPDNISANSTYLEEDLINENPDAILYVTPNWNPGGEGSTYNDHATGVWFDAERQRWAIFNQDREPMPEGAAFNVAVLAQPPG